MVVIVAVGLMIAVALSVTALRRGSGGHAHDQIRQHRSIPPLVAGCLALVIDVIYIWLIWHQGIPVDVPRVAVVASVILLAALLAIIGATTSHPATARVLLIAATVLLLPVGVLGMFSIGLPLFVGGLLTLISACDPVVPPRTDHRPQP